MESFLLNDRAPIKCPNSGKPHPLTVTTAIISIYLLALQLAKALSQRITIACMFKTSVL